MPHSSSRFANYQLVGWLLLWLLAGCAAYTTSVLYTANAQDAGILAKDFPPHWPSLSVLPTAFVQLRWLLTGLTIVFGLLGGLAARRLPTGNLSYAGWQSNRRGIQAELLRGWRALHPHQRHWVLAGLLLLTALRVVASRVGVNVDDVASYECFVRKSLFTVSAYYPAPNNHILSNAISWAFYQAYPGYWWSMRVPVLLLSTASTAGWFLGLLRRTNFRVAALTITLFSFLETSLFAASLGRGYTLVMLFSGLGFFSMLLLSGPALAAGASWRAWACAGLVAAGILGLYAVPTFAYFLVAAYSWLGLRWYHRPAHLAMLAILGTATLLGAMLLYAPLLLVSGPASLFHNQYVKPVAVSSFFHQLPAYVWQLEGELMGESTNGRLALWHVGSLAATFALVGFLGLAGAARSGRLAAPGATPILRTGVPALWMLLLPYSLMVAQRVQAPGRTLGFKAVFMFLLVGLGADWLLAAFGPRVPYLRKGLLLGVGLWAAVEVSQLYYSNELRLSYHRNPHLAAQWLLSHAPGPVLAAGSPWYLPLIQSYLYFEDPTSRVVVDGKPRAGIRYRYSIGASATGQTYDAGQLRLHIPPDLNCEAIDIVSYW